MSRGTLILAFIVAPLATPLVLLGADGLHGMPFWDLGAFVFVAAFAYSATILFGVPSFFLFRAKHWNDVFLYALFGGLIGLLVSVILDHRVPFSVMNLEYRGWHALAGVLSALVFRMLSGVRPDHVVQH